MDKLKCPYVPAGKILVSKKWAKNPLGRELISQHNGVEFSYPEDIVDFIPIQNVPVLLITSDSNTSNLSSRVKRFKEVWKDKGVIITERNLDCLQTHKDVQITITLKKDCNVLPIANLQELPAMLKDLAYTTTHPQNNQFTSAKSVPVDAASKQLHLLTIIPNIGRKKAQILLEKFGHFKRISYATQDELAAVIGVSSAKSIHEFFHKAVSA